MLIFRGVHTLQSNTLNFLGNSETLKKNQSEFLNLNLLRIRIFKNTFKKKTNGWKDAKWWALERWFRLEIWAFLVSMLNFWGVNRQLSKVVAAEIENVCNRMVFTLILWNHKVSFPFWSLLLTCLPVVVQHMFIPDISPSLSSPSKKNKQLT